MDNTVSGVYPNREQKARKSSSPGWDRLHRLYSRVNQSGNLDIMIVVVCFKIVADNENFVRR